MCHFAHFTAFKFSSPQITACCFSFLSIRLCLLQFASSCGHYTNHRARFAIPLKPLSILRKLVVNFSFPYNPFFHFAPGLVTQPAHYRGLTPRHSANHQMWASARQPIIPALLITDSVIRDVYVFSLGHCLSGQGRHDENCALLRFGKVFHFPKSGFVNRDTIDIPDFFPGNAAPGYLSRRFDRQDRIPHIINKCDAVRSEVYKGCVIIFIFLPPFLFACRGCDRPPALTAPKGCRSALPSFCELFHLSRCY